MLLLCFALALSALAKPVTAATTNELDSHFDQQWVRVRLDQNLESVEIEGRGLQVQGEWKAVQPVAIPSEDTLLVTRIQKNGHWLWQVENKYRSQNKTASALVRLIATPFLIVAGSDLRRDGHSIPNHILFSGKKKFNLIAAVRLKDYLQGVLAKEMPMSWPIEALKAQAVAARSYTLAVMREHPKRSFQLESSTLDQVYEKFGSIHAGSEKMDKVIQAVSETSGMVLLTKSTKSVLKAYYHADCGGKTSSSYAAFGTHELKGGVVDSSCPANPSARWKLKISREELAQALKHYFRTPLDMLTIRDVQVKQSPLDQRVSEIYVQTQDGETQVIKAQQLRNLLGFQALRSTRFQVQQKGNEFVFNGVGFGHGVGLCQWGSKVLAQNGTKFSGILQHYYPEAELKAPESSASVTRSAVAAGLAQFQ
jgi:stage II sporulation protein D